MGKFADTFRRNANAALEKTQAAFLNTGSHAFRSITRGSSATGAPGQVVADDNGGDLLNSWTMEISKTKIAITTDSPYAQSNEDGIARPGGGPYVQRSAIGGRHSVQKTEDNLPLIVDHEVAALRRGGK